MKRNRKAKILATLGPASCTSEIIEKLFVAGCDVFRMNFSHSTIEEHRKNYDTIRKLEKKYNHATCILGDLQGPKLRVGNFKNDKAKLNKGNNFILDLDNTPGDEKRVNFPHPEIYENLTPNTIILIDDGKIKLQVIEQNVDKLTTEILNDGIVSNNKGVNIPEIILPISSLTMKDKSDLNKALEMGVDWIALSFVQTAKDIEELQKIVNGKAAIMAKIEKPAAIKNINSIIRLSDGIMIARGDLGVELPTEQVPVIQKNIINLCREFGKPVVVATQMLESMINNQTPTRAEASDVANAIYDGTDAVMLSAETAIGSYPDESIKMMDKIIEKVESDPLYLNINESGHVKAESTAEDAITESAKYVARIMSAKAVITYTTSGSTALRAARERPDVPIMGISPNLNTARRLALVWGVHCIHTKDARSFKDMVLKAGRLAKKEKFAKRGDRVVITAGVPFGQSGATNVLRIASVDRY